MNDLRSPSEDRPYHLSARPAATPSPRLAQDDADPEYGMSFFDRIRYSRWFPLASVFAAVLIFSGIVSYAYKQGSQTGVNATTPVVAADTKDYKEKPANPGGMDVPFQDAVVFDQLQNKGQTPTATDGKTESLLPPPEQPVANNAAPATATTPETTATPPAAPATTTPPVAANTSTPPVAAPATATTNLTATPDTDLAPAPLAAAPPEEAPVEKPAPVKKAATPVKKTTAAAAPPKTTAVKAEAGSYRIQLGAFHDESAARAAWSKVAKQYGSLAGVTPAFPRADLGAKGIFYRAQGTNLSKASADSLCKTINSGKAGSCIVTH